MSNYKNDQIALSTDPSNLQSVYNITDIYGNKNKTASTRNENKKNTISFGNFVVSS